MSSWRVRRPQSPLARVLVPTAVLFVLIVIGQLWLADASLIHALVAGLVVGVLFAAVQYWSIRREARRHQ